MSGAHIVHLQVSIAHVKKEQPTGSGLQRLQFANVFLLPTSPSFQGYDRHVNYGNGIVRLINLSKIVCGDFMAFEVDRATENSRHWCRPTRERIALNMNPTKRSARRQMKRFHVDLADSLLDLTKLDRVYTVSAR